VPCGGHIKIGNVALLHGDQIGSSINVAKKLVDSVHGAAVMGHAHRPSMYTATSLTTATDQWSGYTLPCLCTVPPAYSKGQPNAFCSAFGILEQGSTCINVHSVVITNGTFNLGRRRVRHISS
jgi:hypothetical protein